MRARRWCRFRGPSFTDQLRQVHLCCLVLDQSMIMAALDNALENRAIQRDFARDPVSWAAHTYLSIETMSLR
jgi:hypothetical protein